MIAYRHNPQLTVSALGSSGAIYALSASFSCRATLSTVGAWGSHFQRPTMAAIARRVAAAWGVTVDELKGQIRGRRVAWPRHEAMYEMYATGLFSLPQIGRYLGGRDHTTVYRGCRRHAERNGLPQIVGRR